jgi:hypothetical protein
LIGTLIDVGPLPVASSPLQLTSSSQYADDDTLASAGATLAPA